MSTTTGSVSKEELVGRIGRKRFISEEPTVVLDRRNMSMGLNQVVWCSLLSAYTSLTEEWVPQFPPKHPVKPVFDEAVTTQSGADVGDPGDVPAVPPMSTTEVSAENAPLAPTGEVATVDIPPAWAIWDETSIPSFSALLTNVVVSLRMG